MENYPLFGRVVNSAAAHIRGVDSTGIIAEFKRKSPSKGLINGTADVSETTRGYVRAGVACLSSKEVMNLSEFAHELGLEVLLEVHDADELARSLCNTVDLVGVNNRNLKTFETSVETSLQLVNQIPASFVRVTESGLHDAATILMLREAGYDAFLIGEAFMKTTAPDVALAALVGQLNKQKFANPL